MTMNRSRGAPYREFRRASAAEPVPRPRGLRPRTHQSGHPAISCAGDPTAPVVREPAHGTAVRTIARGTARRRRRPSGGRDGARAHRASRGRASGPRAPGSTRGHSKDPAGCGSRPRRESDRDDGSPRSRRSGTACRPGSGPCTARARGRRTCLPAASGARRARRRRYEVPGTDLGGLVARGLRLRRGAPTRLLTGPARPRRGDTPPRPRRAGPPAHDASAQGDPGGRPRGARRPASGGHPRGRATSITPRRAAYPLADRRP